MEIAREAKVDEKDVYIDVPTVPSVPNHHSVLLENMEIPVFYRDSKGEKIPQRLSEISKIYETLKGFMNILRVYSEKEKRDRVASAASKILGRIPSTARISY
jgi:hypothetical protein